MFNFFKKQRDEIIDLREKRKTTSSETANETAPESSLQETSFLSDLATAASDSASVSESMPSSGAVLANDDKISALSSRLYKLLERFDLMELKIFRLEKRLGLREEISEY